MLLKTARAAQALGDYPASQRATNTLLEEVPVTPEIAAIQAENHRQTEKQHLAKLGGLERRPVLAVTPQELVWHDLSPPEGFVLSRVDGFITCQDIIDISHLPRHETLRLLANLVTNGLLSIR